MAEKTLKCMPIRLNLARWRRNGELVLHPSHFVIRQDKQVHAMILHWRPYIPRRSHPLVVKGAGSPWQVVVPSTVQLPSRQARVDRRNACRDVIG